MKKVLVITYYWPPSGGGGVQRWLKFVKYFREFGWEPIVFTPENPEMPAVDHSLLAEIPQNIEVVKNKIWEPYSIYKKFTFRKKEEKIQTAFLNENKSRQSILDQLSVWIRGNLFIPDARRFWIKPSVKFLENFIKENKVDALVTTGPPHSAHLIGLKLKRKFGIPWLADFRDPWTNIDYYQDLKLGKRANRKHHQLEKKVLETANAVIVISPGMKKEFKSIVERTYSVIPNGYDKEDVPEKSEETGNFHKFSLAHIGSLTKTRNPVNLWKALHQLVNENEDFAKDLEIRNIGKMDISARESINKYKLTSYLKNQNYLPHNKVIQEQSRAGLLLLLINNTPNAKLILTGKIFEYLAAKRPIICIGPTDGDAALVIRESGCGSVFGFEEVNLLKKEILRSYKLFIKGTLVVDGKNVEQFERRNLTGKMAAMLDTIG